MIPPHLLLHWLCLMWLALAFAAPAAAQTPNIRAELVVEHGTVPAGGTSSVALAMTPAPGWHGYWKNGGDAGFGLTIDWDVPDGFNIGPFAYPVPDLLTISGLMNHVYKAPYALIAPLTVPPGLAAGSEVVLTGRARWLACTDRICVPESALVAARLTVGAPGPADPRFAGWRAALPPLLDRSARWQRDGARLRVALPVPAAAQLAAPHLFAAAPDLVDYAAPQRFSRNGDWLVVETAAKGGHSGPAELLLRLGPGRGLVVTAQPGAVPAAGEPVELAATGFNGALFGWALAGAIVGGLLLNLMPCVFPILSLKALSLARAGGDAGAARAEALAYLAGATLTALALGALLLALRAGGAQIGWAFQLQHPVSIYLLLLLAGAITANLLGLFELPAFGGGQGAAGAGGVRGGFATGALAAFVATPCSGPFMGAALGATLALPALASLVIFGGLGLGLALPFVAVATIPALRTRLPRPGPWMAGFRRWLALPMALTAAALAWLLWRQTGLNGLMVGLGALGFAGLALAAWGARLRGTAPRWAAQFALGSALVAVAAGAANLPRVQPVASTAVAAARPWSAAAVAAARAAGQPVLVVFTADWCITCKVNERTSIARPDVQAALVRANVVQLTGDWTSGDPAITAALAGVGRNSLPTTLWYAPGADAPALLPQILTPAMLIARAEAP